MRNKLFHYTITKGLLGISSGEFWATDRGFLNDYTEFQIATDVFCEMLHSRMKNAEKRERIQNRLRERVNYYQNPVLTKDEKRKFAGDYVISFCLEENSPFMWSSYSNHKGYSIRFDYAGLMNAFNEATKGYLDGQVVYDADTQIECLEETLKRDFFDESQFYYLNSWDDFEHLSDDEIDNWIECFSVNISAYNMFFKKACFASEREYRVVFMVIHEANRDRRDIEKLYFRERNNALLPFIKVPIGRKGIESIEHVWIGARNGSDVAEAGVRHLFKYLDHNVGVSTAEFPLR